MEAIKQDFKLTENPANLDNSNRRYQICPFPSLELFSLHKHLYQCQCHFGIKDNNNCIYDIPLQGCTQDHLNKLEHTLLQEKILHQF